MRWPTALLLTWTLSWTASCGSSKPKPEPIVEPPPRLVVVTIDDPLCDVSLFPRPESTELPPRDVLVDRVCMPDDAYRTIVGALARWRARAEKYERCEALREAARQAREHLTSADAGVE